MIRKRSPSPRPSTATFQLNYTVESGNEIKVQVMIGVRQNGRHAFFSDQKLCSNQFLRAPIFFQFEGTPFNIP